MPYLHLLEDWIPPMSMTAMKFGEHLARHCETFGRADKLFEKLKDLARRMMMKSKAESTNAVQVLRAAEDFLTGPSEDRQGRRQG